MSREIASGAPNVLPAAAGARKVGRYAMFGEIASGGMATVHLGRLLGPAGFSRTVAIKCLHPSFANDPDFVAMFLDEARLATRVHHPNVVPTLDVVTEGNEIFLVMEFVLGDTLAGLLRTLNRKGERVPPAIAASIVAGALYGLHAAHEATGDGGAPLGIVHRDVSPQNVMVGADGVPRVLDFGIAKAANRVQTTREGQVKGKLAYMAPEQILDQEIDRRADVFAASIVLWETFTGQRLFAAEHPGATVQAVLARDIPLPSTIAIGLPAALDDIVLRGLARHKDARFATAREMAIALENAIAPATAREVGDWLRGVAGDALDDRSKRVAAIEATPADGAPALDAPPARHDEARDAAQETTVVGVTAAHAVRSATRSSRLPLIVALAALASGLAAVSFVLGRGSSPAAVANSAAAASPDAPKALAIATAPSPSATASSVDAPAASSASPADTASTEPSGPPPGTRAKPAAATRTNAHAASCKNPFTVDARGLRVPRPECF